MCSIFGTRRTLRVCFLIVDLKSQMSLDLYFVPFSEQGLEL